VSTVISGIAFAFGPVLLALAVIALIAGLIWALRKNKNGDAP
jgi:hypothetical protein